MLHPTKQLPPKARDESFQLSSQNLETDGHILSALIVFIAVIALGRRFFHFISTHAINILFSDQWDVLTPLFQGNDSVPTLFRWLHGPHREGVGLVADRILYSLTNWNTRAECFMIGGTIFLAMLLAILLKQRLFGKLSYTDVAIPLTFLTLAQFEVLTVTPNPGYSAFPLLLVVLYCLTLLVRRDLLRYGLLLAIDFLLIYTGFGLFMGVVTIAVFALEGYWRLRRVSAVPLAAPIAAFLISCAELGSFFVGYKFDPSAACFTFPYHDLSAYPQFMALMFANFLGIEKPAPPLAVGTVVLLVTLAILAISLYRLRRGLRRLELVIAVLLGQSLLFAANTAVGRVCLGYESATASRYTISLIPLFLAIYFFLLSLPSLGKQVTSPIWVLILLPGCLNIPLTSANPFTDEKRLWAECYVRAEDIAYCNQKTHFFIYPNPPESTHLKQKLDYLKQHRLSLFADYGASAASPR